MTTAIAYYVTEHDGIVIVRKEESWNNKPIYCAYWAPSFLHSIKLSVPDDNEQTLPGLMDWLKEWDNTLTEIKDFGEYQLYGRYENGRLTGVCTESEPDFDYTEPLRAREVPVGTFLANEAVDFFQFWLGKDSVDVRSCLLKQKE